MAVEMLQPGTAGSGRRLQRADRRRSRHGGNRSRGRQFARAGSSGSRGTFCRLSRATRRGRGIEDGMMLESRKPNGQVVTGSVRLVHAAGMHARPAVKLTKLAKKFQAQISIRASDAAEWINAKSIAKVMALRAARDSIIEIKASGEDAASRGGGAGRSRRRRFSGHRSVNDASRHCRLGIPGQDRLDRFRAWAIRARRCCANGRRAAGRPKEEELALREALAAASRQIADAGRRCQAARPRKSLNFRWRCWKTMTFSNRFSRQLSREGLRTRLGRRSRRTDRGL